MPRVRRAGPLLRGTERGRRDAAVVATRRPRCTQLRPRPRCIRALVVWLGRRSRLRYMVSRSSAPSLHGNPCNEGASAFGAHTTSARIQRTGGLAACEGDWRARPVPRGALARVWKRPGYRTHAEAGCGMGPEAETHAKACFGMGLRASAGVGRSKSMPEGALAWIEAQRAMPEAALAWAGVRQAMPEGLSARIETLGPMPEGAPAWPQRRVTGRARRQPVVSRPAAAPRSHQQSAVGPPSDPPLHQRA